MTRVKNIGFVSTMKMYIFIICIGLVASNVYAEEQKNLNQLMTEVGEVMMKVLPIMVSKQEWSEEQKSTTDQAINDLSRLFGLAGPYIAKYSDTYQISYEFMSEYLKVTRFIYDTGDFDYTRSHLFAIGEICSTCHTQDTTLRTLFAGTGRENFDDDNSYAEFNFITRNYPEAIKYFDKHLTNPAPKSELAIIQPLQRLITIYTQVFNDPLKGIEQLQSYQEIKGHTHETKIQLTQWIEGLKDLRSHMPASSKLNYRQISQLADEFIGGINRPVMGMNANPKQEVARVWLRGQLFHYLNGKPSRPEIPRILYWLAIIDRSIAYNFYFSLTELYLKQCVLKYSKDPFANRCFEEYLAYTEHTYTRAGRSIPAEIRQEITVMRKALSK